VIIKIEDAPHIKHIKIDINFDEDDTPSIKIDNSSTSNTSNTLSTQDVSKSKSSLIDDIPLNTDEDFNVQQEIVEKPEIPDVERDVKVSNDMENLEF